MEHCPDKNNDLSDATAACTTNLSQNFIHIEEEETLPPGMGENTDEDEQPNMEALVAINK